MGNRQTHTRHSEEKQEKEVNIQSMTLAKTQAAIPCQKSHNGSKESRYHD